MTEKIRYTENLQKKSYMSIHRRKLKYLVFLVPMLLSATGFAHENSYRQARALQREGKFDDAIEAFKICLLKPLDDAALTDHQLNIYTDALLQMMNTFQSKGEPEACVSALQEVFMSSHILQTQCLRDYYSVLGYALSRTENMAAAQDATLKALSLPLDSATPQRYFRDYAYAAAVFYSNPDYLNEVIVWCKEALLQAQLCENTSGKQWVTAMLGSLYKRSGDLHDALDLFQQSKIEAQSRNDDLGVLNSLNSLVDLFLYWDLPEYADVYATEALRVEKRMASSNPMVSAQTYINKGRALHQLGNTDSIPFYNEQARRLCVSLPYNSGMVDVNLLNGICFTERGGDSLQPGIQELQNVTTQGTDANRAKAYHQLAQTYLKHEEDVLAEIMLDSLYSILNQCESHVNILRLDFEPILAHYLKIEDHERYEHYVRLLYREQQIFKENRINANLVDAIVDFQTEKKLQDFKIEQLIHANERLWLLVSLAAAVILILVIIAILFNQKRRYKVLMREADLKQDALIQKLNQSNIEKQQIAQEVKEFLDDKDKRQELETLTPHVLKESGEIKFRQCFELLYPLFLPRLREKVPTVTRREELLSMLIVLKQDNKEIAELMAVAPRSVLMLRHRFRQKIGLTTEHSLEIFIESLLDKQ